MSEFKLERFKYNWKGQWSGGTSYNRDDVVNVGGRTYVCLVTHTADSDFNTDLDAIVPGSNPPQPAPKWVLHTDGRRWVGTWVTARQYEEGDIVTYDGTVHFCNNGHLSTTFHANASDWTVIAEGTEFQTVWTTATGYGPGALVKYNGIIYKCITPHTSQAYLEDDIEKWSVLHDGIFYAGSYTAGTLYRKNDLVKFGGSIFRVKASHISTANFDQNLYDIELPGFNEVQIWNAGTDYATGDIVRYGGDLYYVTNPIRGIEPTNTGFDSVVYFIRMLYSYNFRGDWDIDQDYAPGDLVRRGGELYKSLVTIKRSDDSSDAVLTDYSDTTKWELVVPGQKYSNYWNYQAISYSKGDVVTYYGMLYECNYPHTSSAITYPGNGSGYPWWTLVADVTGSSGLNAPGDMLTYDKLVDGSSLGPTNVEIGTYDQVLSIKDESTTDPDLFWRNLYATEVTVVYVSPDGTDDYTTGRGLDIRYPFKTIRFACQYVEDNITGPSKVAVSTGRYIETCPIVVPAYCVVMGDELRATTIIANKPVAEYTGDTTYTFSYLARFNDIINDLFTNQDITVTAGNTEAQVKTSPASTTDIGPIFTALVSDITEYIQYKVLSGSTQPTLAGTNTLTTELARIRASEILRVNTKFLQNEAVAYTKETAPEYVFDEDRLKADVNQFIRGIRYDLRYPGNYATIQSGRYYVSQTNGSQLEDMFYFRDITGLRNCTIEGLEGTLAPATGVALIDRRPTAGAFCSLDPGWGPDDDRTWIATRSPYIQGVTTIGTACTGKKVDGNLHNGGNRSMVSNDFTQVLSDGIGAHILNNGRAELVSVFTYYCHLGYLADSGGKIRATNGNNSYGNYGSVAIGIDSTETPATVTVDNRNNEAEVAFAFAGEVTDKILAFEYKHCGEAYTTASSNIVGSGNFAVTDFSDIRDGAVFEARLIQADDSSNIGGARYTNVGNNAQTGNTTTIMLASNDPGTVAEYVGQRIVLTSGVGTGQYGYIQAYDDSTKIATVYKESDGTIGWDHIIPGFEIVASLQTNTQYRVEPRITVSDPPFTVNTRTLPNTEISPKEWTDIAWGETREQFDNLVMNNGSGTVIGASPAPAVVRIIKTGPTYTAVLQSTGVGYAVGDTTTIAGTEIGGTTPANDCVLRVASVSDDSTNSIVSLTVQGTGYAGRWLAVAEGNYSAWSNDGIAWNEIFTASTQQWKTMAHGGTTFVAISNTTTDVVNYSNTGKTWSNTTLPSSAPLKDIHYADGKFVIVCEDDNRVFYSTNGSTWSQTSIPASTSDDLSSSSKQWQGVTHGYGKWLAVSGSDRAVATSTDAITWTVTEDQMPTPGGVYDWCGVTFGNGRFVAVSKNTGTSAYCIGDPATTTWQTSSMPNLDDSTHMNWNRVRYANGVFFAVCDTGNRTISGDATTGPTTLAASSSNGLTWTARNMTFNLKYSSCAYGKSNNSTSEWFTTAKGGNTAVRVGQGSKAIVRANIASGVIGYMKIWDPGSGYTSSPSLTLFDNKATTDAQVEMRIGNGVLAQPTFVNRGIGYRTSTTIVTITGDGYADKIPSNSTDLTVTGINVYPTPGAQLSITGVMNTDTTEDLTDLREFTIVKITKLGDDGSGNGTKRALFRISPKIENSDDLAHGTSASIREQYSQCRISGHDLLDIGSGNFEQTNYPELYVAGQVFDVYPENETFERDGGRVFYTSTDQDGNFRAGELFSVEQGTGIVTISADFFDLDGLSELALGGVRLGGSGTVVREFSTDPLFLEDSNNIVPTQKAVVTFLATRLSEGGSEIETNNLTAGLVKLGGENNIIEHTGDGGAVSGTVPGTAFEVVFPKTTNFAGQYAGVTGMPLAMRLFLMED